MGYMSVTGENGSVQGPVGAKIQSLFLLLSPLSSEEFAINEVLHGLHWGEKKISTHAPEH